MSKIIIIYKEKTNFKGFVTDIDRSKNISQQIDFKDLLIKGQYFYLDLEKFSIIELFDLQEFEKDYNTKVELIL